jgi:hypothetical protein
VRRFVATLLVVASPAVLAVPVGAADGRAAGPVGAPAAPAVAPVAPVSIAPPVVPQVAPAAVPTPAAAVATARSAVRRAATGRVRPRVSVPVAVDDAAYRTRLQAELCRARTIFCGLDSRGHYPAG